MTDSGSMPAETAPHERTADVLAGASGAVRRADARSRAAHAEVARTIAGFEPVTMIAAPGSGSTAEKQCGGAVEVIELPLDDSWARDSGPIYVLSADGTRRVALDWVFNGWGEKYPPWDEDDALAPALGGASRPRGAVGADGARGRFDRRRRRGNARHHRAVPAPPQPQPEPDPAGHRGSSARGARRRHDRVAAPRAGPRRRHRRPRRQRRRLRPSRRARRPGLRRHGARTTGCGAMSTAAARSARSTPRGGRSRSSRSPCSRSPRSPAAASPSRT